MKRLLIIFVAGIFLLFLAVWFAIPVAKPPGFSVGKPLPHGKIKPQLVCVWDTAVLLAPDGSLWAWGGAQFQLQGQFGPPTVTAVPQRIGSDSDWRSVAASWVHTIALKNDGTLWGWGWNGSGQIAQTNVTNHFGKPVRIGTDTNWSAIAAGAGQCLALKNDGSLWAWGQNDEGQVGNGTTSNQFSPMPIAPGQSWKSIAAGAFNSFAINADGTVWGWGLDPVSGGKSNVLSPKQIDPGTNWVALSTGDYTVIGLRSDGALWIRGQNVHSIIPSQTTSNTARFTKIGTNSDWTDVDDGQGVFFARKRDGSWWVGGSARNGETGLGKAARSDPPRQLPFKFEPWAFVTGNGTTCLLTEDGTLWTWGERLGTGNSPAHPGWKATANHFLDLFHVKKSWRYNLSTITDYSPHRLWELPSAMQRSLLQNPHPDTPAATNAAPTH